MKINDLLKLLRTPEEASIVGKTLGKLPYVLHLQKSNREIIIYGTTHTGIAEKVQELKKFFENENPNLLLIEGSVRDYINITRTKQLSDDDLLKKFGEQAYLALIAQRKDIKVKSWDINIIERIRYALKKNLPKEDIIGYMVLIRARHEIEAGGKPSVKTVVERLENGLTKKVKKVFEDEFGIDMEDVLKNLDVISMKYAGVPLSELFLEKLKELTGPARSKGAVNMVARIMNDARDENALKIIKDVRNKYKKILVTCGGYHFLRWEPAIKTLYKTN